MAGGLLAAPLAARAQPAGKTHRIGFLGNSTEALEANLVGPFRAGFRELGYAEGRDLVIEYRWADGQYERFPALIAELLVLSKSGQSFHVTSMSSPRPGALVRSSCRRIASACITEHGSWISRHGTAPGPAVQRARLGTRAGAGRSAALIGQRVPVGS